MILKKKLIRLFELVYLCEAFRDYDISSSGKLFILNQSIKYLKPRIRSANEFQISWVS